MKVTRVKLADLLQPEENIRYHTEAQLKEFERSVKMFGQIRPIVIDENNVILAGNGLYATLKNMGMKDADCYKVTGLTENQKKKLMIADNKVYSLGVDNLEVIDKFIADLAGDLDIPGFDEEVLRQMTADASAVTEELSTYGTLDQSQLEQFRQAGTKTQQAISEKPETADSGSEEQENAKNSEDRTTFDSVEPGEDPERKYITCPNCGEKIWL